MVGFILVLTYTACSLISDLLFGDNDLNRTWHVGFSDLNLTQL